MCKASIEYREVGDSPLSMIILATYENAFTPKLSKVMETHIEKFANVNVMDKWPWYHR